MLERRKETWFEKRSEKYLCQLLLRVNMRKELLLL